MKKLKLNDELLQHAERISREQQKAILGGYGSTSGGGGACYTAQCWSKTEQLLATLNTYPSVCTDYTFTIACENAMPPGEGYLVWWQGCCGT
jgi:hypothetical protein